MEPRRPIFEKCSHLREKGGVLMLFKTIPHLGAKAQYIKQCAKDQYRQPPVCNKKISKKCWASMENHKF
jgi:hypothetical protein